MKHITDFILTTKYPESLEIGGILEIPGFVSYSSFVGESYFLMDRLLSEHEPLVVAVACGSGYICKVDVTDNKIVGIWEPLQEDGPMVILGTRLL